MEIQQETQDEIQQQAKQETLTTEQPTDKLTVNSQPQTNKTTTAPLATLSTLSIIEKQILSFDEQQSFQYWTGKVNFGGKMKKRYDLFPNQLYHLISNPKELETYFDDIERGKQIKYKDRQNELRKQNKYKKTRNFKSAVVYIFPHITPVKEQIKGKT